MSSKKLSCHVVTNHKKRKDGSTYKVHLLRHTYREGDKVKKRTLGNISHLPDHLIEILRLGLDTEGKLPPLSEGTFDTPSSKDHGDVAAVLGTLKKIGLDRILLTRKTEQRELCVAMIAARILLGGASKLSTAQYLDEETSTASLGDVLGLGKVTAEDLYAAMDWIVDRQDKIEKALAKRHLTEKMLVLYDVSSSYLEGSECELGARGHSRDRKKGKLQIVYGLLCNAEGCPVAITVYEGNTADPSTLGDQIEKVRGKFGLKSVVFVADRGLLTTARIKEELAPVEGLEWISALRSGQIKKLVDEQGPVQMSLFDKQDLAEVSHPDFPGERLVVCLNPLLAGRRKRKREELMVKTEEELEKIAKAVKRDKNPLRGKDKIGVRAGKKINLRKVGKHFDLNITDSSFEFSRNEQSIAKEAKLDGLYVIRTSVSKDTLAAEDAVRAYKSLGQVEQAFRFIKTGDLQVRPIYHRLEKRVRAHVFLCMLAYYVEWHMRKAWAPLLFAEDNPKEAESLRSSPVVAAQRSESAKRKAGSKKTKGGKPVLKFRNLLRQLSGVVRNTHGVKEATFDHVTTPNKLQLRALDLLGVKLLM